MFNELVGINFKRRPGKRPPRSGIILLVVLGMLTLFSILAVSYLVFTNSQRTAAFNINRAEVSHKNPQPWLDETTKQILVGANGPDSSLWGHDLLGDLYGMRDGVEGQITPVNDYTVADNEVAPEVLLDAFIRLPTQLYKNAVLVNQRYADPTLLAERQYPKGTGNTRNTSFPTDESITGRILTFTDGPLKDLSFRIVRYFGDHRNATNGRPVLTGQLVLDFRPHLHRSVTVASRNETKSIGEWLEDAKQARFDVSLFFYNRVPDVSSPNNSRPLASFYINGQMLNGPGLGWDLERDDNTTLAATGTEFNLNETISVNFNPTSTNPTTGSVNSGTKYEGTSNGADIPVPLQGHYAIYRREPDSSPPNSVQSYLQDLPSGDADEPYDAPDDQNWWLSYFPDNPGSGVNPLGSPAPSFVRPGLIHWLINQQSGQLDSLPPLRLQQIVRAIQRATLRPLPLINDPAMPSSIANRGPGVLQLDYSNFSGGQNVTTPLGNQIDFQNLTPAVVRNLARQLVGHDFTGDGKPDWDVDNDGDGRSDSVWIDIGLPLTQSEDGTLAKPLVAILIEDLGGRVNVNLAGNLAQARNRVPKTASGVLARGQGNPMGALYQASDLPAGFGYGPAEQDIRALFQHPTVQTGNGSLNLLRRRLISRTVGGVEYVAAGNLLDPRTNDGNDLFGVLRQPYLANIHRPSNAQGLPVDKFGRGSIALGINGGLMVAGTVAPLANAGASAGDSSDDPYELDLSPAGQPDNIFTGADLEAVLRFDDFDREALNSELMQLAEAHFRSASNDQSTVNAARREFAHSVTTESNSVAAAVGPQPSEHRDSTSNTTSQRSLPPQAVLSRSLKPSSNTIQERNALLMQLLPHEVLSGGKLDLNRPFGNGVDDDGDGVVDDPQELRTVVQVFYRDFTGTPSNTVYTTPYTDVTVGVPGPYDDPANPPANAFPEPTPQALFARHLYVMAMTLVRDGTGTDEFDFTNGNTANITIDASKRTQRFDSSTGTWVNNPKDDEYRAWVLAQWAINVADFRDKDAIMSRFDYDVYPFDGWNISPPGGSGPPTSRTVWGMEFPELALEESLAFHDRRVRDTRLDTNMQERFPGGAVADPHPDQWRIPQGSLFLELRSTRSPDHLRVPSDDADDTAQPWAVPAELYAAIDVDPDPAQTRMEYMLDLARTAPDRNPIWRVAITRAHPSMDPASITDGPVGASDPELAGDEMLQPVGSNNLRVFDKAQPSRLTATLQPERPDFFGPDFTDAIERVIWFGTEDPDSDRDGNIDFPTPADTQGIEKIFYNRFTDTDYRWQDNSDTGAEVYLRGGQHAIIGPRVTTVIGSLATHNVAGPTHDPNTDEPLVQYNEYESPQRFDISTYLFEHHLISNSNASPTVESGAGTPYASRRSVLGIVSGANPPSGFTGPPIAPNAMAIGLNVSEPLPFFAPALNNRYYSSPTAQLKGDFPFDSYYDYDNTAGAFPDEPFDARPYAELYKVYGPEGQQTGTRERFKTAYLQRLADPTRSYDPISNPYLTVDYITIDLTVFNGSDSNSQAGPNMEWVDEADPEPFTTDPEEAFATRYKTGRTVFQAYDVPNITENLSHSINTYPPVQTARTPAAEMGGNVPYFDITLNLHTAVNPDTAPVSPIPAPDRFPPRIAHSSSLGFANASYGPRWRQGQTADASVANYIGTPHSNWFSTVTWLNRPYVSPGELMWVPTTSAGRFAAHFGTATANTGYTAGGDFYTDNDAGLTDRHEYTRVFPHLWNYFSGNANDLAASPNLWRIMDWVKTPAPYDFENDFLSTNEDVLQNQAVSTPSDSSFGGRLNYLALGGTGTTGNPDTWVASPSNGFWLNRWTIEAFRTPLNILDPPFRKGRINLNTIKNPRVYRALMNGISESSDPTEGAFYPDFVTSRRGYTPTNDSEDINLDSANPVFNAKRASQFAGAFRPSSASDIAPLPDDRSSHPLAKTIMRPGGTLDTPTPEPLFSRSIAGASVLESWRARSVSHQQLPITRLSNMACDQSNVFGVWVTVGLFEVDSASLSVGREVGSDLGKVERYRQFQVIDRSIPTMYQPGVLNNAAESIILSRRLQ